MLLVIESTMAREARPIAQIEIASETRGQSSISGGF